MSQNLFDEDLNFYGGESQANDDFYEKQEKAKKRIKFAFISISLVLIICVSVFAFNYYNFKKPYELVASLVGLPDPNQQETTGEFVKVIDEYEVNFEKKANYVLYGRVEEKFHYNPSRSFINKLSEYDLGIVWGKLLAENLEDMKFRNNGSRFLTYRYSQSFTNKMGGKENIINSLSNNHIIPDNEYILKCLKYLKEGEYIKLEGYLVNVTYKSDFDKGEWPTSLSRTDHGDGACEVFYVTNLTWLKKG